eukprot:CAMPEP_0194341592 /NCGR_PEP_ID=MMETSP0171-20130528/90173_1 /TAXON_ID=218684 /ORGANISM="Corethron pennatum, Strain L29A3" /LENGTH=283 /DNA_ID=CAMNT_0039106993 /DNA_START=453 /DNA_END=1305 /DNA_ORIENTATION=-
MAGTVEAAPKFTDALQNPESCDFAFGMWGRSRSASALTFLFGQQATSGGPLPSCPTLQYYSVFVIVAVGSFHLGIFLSTGLHFWAQLTTVALGIFTAMQDLTTTSAPLYPDSDHFIGAVTIAVPLLLGIVVASVCPLESWPFNGLSIFPFNHEQMMLLQHSLIKSNIRILLCNDATAMVGREVSKKEVTELNLHRLASSLENGLSSVYTAGFHRAVDWKVLTSSVSGNDNAMNHAVINLDIWLQHSLPYRFSSTGEPLNRACIVRKNKEESWFIVATGKKAKK